MSFLTLIIVLSIAVCLVSVLRRLHLPPILGYLITGVIVGPGVLELVAPGKQLSFVAEFGVVFLLFTIGLELSLPKLISMRRSLLGLGGLQVVLCAGAIYAICVFFSLEEPDAFTIAGALALSSTAVAVKQLLEQGELALPHGRTILSILLFQDLAAVPFLIIIPTFAAHDTALSTALFDATLKGLAVFGIMLLAGRFLLRPMFHVVAAARSSELFMLAAILVALGSAYITEHLGLSMALGAFLAGVMLAETEYHKQIENDILPFRDIFLGLFFITIGLMLSPKAIIDNIFVILGIVVSLVVGKTILISVLGLVAGLKPNDAIRAGLGLAQGGEFGFALLALAFDHQILTHELNQIIIASIIFSIMLAPFLIKNSESIANFIMKAFDKNDAPVTPEAVIPTGSAAEIEDHVIICGFGRVGQSVARFLEREGVQYIGLDLDPSRLKEAHEANEPVIYGDCTDIDLLKSVGLGRAKLLMISFAEYKRAMKTIQQIRDLGLDIPILVRAKDDRYLDELQEAGATEVIPELMEASLMLAKHTLVMVGKPIEKIHEIVQEEKANRYQMLRGFFRGDDDIEHIEQSSQMLHAVTMNAGARAIGQTIGSLINDEKKPVNITAFKRDGIKTEMPTLDTVVKEGDILILCGAQQEVYLAEERLLQG